jgi:hypothetical protein
MLSSLERHIPLLENYLTAANQQDFLDQITDPAQKKLLNLLTQQPDDMQVFRQELKQAVLPSNIQEALIDDKLLRYAEQSTQLGDDSIGREIRSRFGCKSFDYPKPISANTETAEKEEDSVPS